ncbi:hypothetical protein [Lonepinella sp. MS14436]|uniref:hypothetical protein n=1 Tax=Lonepinella sp. MS14436 TaxID=3003619 RepID=UPI0036DCE27D
MASPFDVALLNADKIIEQTIMSACLINGTQYQAVFDEVPKEIEAVNSGYVTHNFVLNGAYRTVTLFKTQGYQPKRGDIVTIDDKQYGVTGFGYQDGVLTLQVE